MNVLRDAIDVHVHSAPDVVGRSQHDIALAQSGAKAGMRAMVIKSHHFPTADRARLASLVVPGIQMIGGLVLNATSCGGINVDAVRVSFEVGGRVIWLPTVSAQNHLDFLGKRPESRYLAALTVSEQAVAVVDSNGKVVPALDPVFNMITDHDGVLATGHISPRESVVVIERALSVGVRRIVVTHPEAPFIAMPVASQLELARAGVFFEHCYLSVINGLSPRELLARIREVGIESTILATDLGQADNVPAVVGFKAFYEAMATAGMTPQEWHLATSHNPARLLGLAMCER